MRHTGSTSIVHLTLVGTSLAGPLACSTDDNGAEQAAQVDLCAEIGADSELAGSAVVFGRNGDQLGFLGPVFAVGPGGARYSGGMYSGVGIDLKPGDGAPQNNVPDDDHVMWLNRIEADGTFLYGHSWSHDPGVMGINGAGGMVHGISPDAAGNVYVFGRLFGAVDLDPGPGVDLQPEGDEHNDAFLIKLGPDGAHQWGRTWSASWGNIWPSAIAWSPDDAIYVAGSFSGVIDLDPGDGEDLRDPGDIDAEPAFLSKFSPDGAYLWGDVFGAGQNAVQGLDVAAAGEVALTRCQSTVEYDPIFGETYVSDGCYVRRVGPDGGSRWEFNIDASLTQVRFDGQGRIWTAGSVDENGGDIDPGPGTTTLAGTSEDRAYFLARYSAGGAYESMIPVVTQPWGGIADLAVGCGDQLYVGGSFSGTVDFDPGPGEARREGVAEGSPYVLALTTDGAYRWVQTWSGEGRVSGVRFESTSGVHAQLLFSGTQDVEPGEGITNKTAVGANDILLEILRPSTGTW